MRERPRSVTYNGAGEVLTGLPGGHDVSGLLLPADRPKKWRRKKVF